MLSRTVVFSLALVGDPDAALLRSWVSLEPNGTGAGCDVVVAAADCVRAADIFSFAGVLAFVFDAGFGGVTVSVVTTTDYADTVYTGLVVLTLVVCYARYCADFVDAFLALGTVVGVTTSS